MRRREVERGAAEIKKNEDDIQRQKEEMEHLESLYKSRMEEKQNMCSQEKVHPKTDECQKPSLLRALKCKY